MSFSVRFILTSCLCLLTIFVNISLPTTTAFGQQNTNIIHFLIPLTTQEDLVVCNNYFNEQEQYEKTLECTAKYFTKKKIPTKLPTCYVIKKSSNDIRHFKGNKDGKDYDFNYISTLLFGIVPILGFYEDNTVYLVENTKIGENEDLQGVFRHEILHYLLESILGYGDAGHEHPAWLDCFNYPPTSIH